MLFVSVLQLLVLVAPAVQADIACRPRFHASEADCLILIDTYIDDPTPVSKSVGGRGSITHNSCTFIIHFGGQIQEVTRRDLASKAQAIYTACAQGISVSGKLTSHKDGDHEYCLMNTHDEWYC